MIDQIEFETATSRPSADAPAKETGVVRGGVALLLRAEGALVLAVAVTGWQMAGGSWGLFALLLLTPDLAMLGYLANPRLGANLYNTAHTYLAPALLAALLFAIGGIGLASFALIWVAHIGMDRMLGYGLKYPDAFGATHLGRIGKGGH